MTSIARDSRQSPPVAIVNETFVRKTLGGADPLGRIVRLETPPGEPAQTFEIVGVARDAKHTELRQDFEPLVVLAAVAGRGGGRLGAIRDQAARRARRAACRPWPSASPRSIRRSTSTSRCLNETIRGGLVRERLMAALSGAFGTLAGLLAAVGLYGVMSYTVARRSNEIGIRLAMGARRGAVLRMVLREAGVLVAIGLVIGTALGLGADALRAHAAVRLAADRSGHRRRRADAAGAIGLGASYLPARRASRLDPVRVLRDE